MNAEYQILHRTPDIDDFIRLRRVGGLSTFTREAVEIGLKGTLFAVTARHDNQTIGMGRIVGDGGCFFTIVDIVVDPDHQGRGVGKRIVSELMEHVKTQLPKSAWINLFADVPANKLYEKFGFEETAPITLGMSYRVV